MSIKQVNTSQTLTSSDHWVLHDLTCDWTEVLVGSAVRDGCHLQILDLLHDFTPQAQRL